MFGMFDDSHFLKPVKPKAGIEYHVSILSRRGKFKNEDNPPHMTMNRKQLRAMGKLDKNPFCIPALAAFSRHKLR